MSRCGTEREHAPIACHLCVSLCILLLESVVVCPPSWWWWWWLLLLLLLFVIVYCVCIEEWMDLAPIVMMIEADYLCRAIIKVATAHMRAAKAALDITMSHTIVEAAVAAVVGTDLWTIVIMIRMTVTVVALAVTTPMIAVASLIVIVLRPWTPMTVTVVARAVTTIPATNRTIFLMTDHEDLHIRMTANVRPWTIAV
jgi:hypothetical protein